MSGVKLHAFLIPEVNESERSGSGSSYFIFWRICNSPHCTEVWIGLYLNCRKYHLRTAYMVTEDGTTDNAGQKHSLPEYIGKNSWPDARCGDNWSDSKP
jgi:hypothetical protein